MAMYVRPRTKQNCKLAFLLLLSAVATVLLPVAAGTVRWIVIAIPTRTVVNDELVIDSFEELQVGLFRTCAETPWERNCESNDFSDTKASIVSGCEKNMRDLGHRTRATAAFILLAFFASLPLLVITIFHFRQSLFVDEERTLNLIVTKLPMTRRKGLVLRLGAASTTLVFVLIALCVYGDTMGRWIGCGDHYCSGMLENTRRQAENFVPPSGTDVHRDVRVNCGYGFSFAMLIACLFMMLAYISITLIDFLMTAPKAPVDRPPPSAPAPITGPSAEQQDEVQQSSEGGVPASTTEMSPLKQGPAGDGVLFGFAGPESSTRGGPGKANSSSFIVNTTASSHAPPRLLPEGDDWEWDDESKLWWSQAQELFFDEESGHFYDSESQSWFNPQTQNWYKI